MYLNSFVSLWVFVMYLYTVICSLLFRLYCLYVVFVVSVLIYICIYVFCITLRLLKSEVF